MMNEIMYMNKTKSCWDNNGPHLSIFAYLSYIFGNLKVYEQDMKSPHLIHDMYDAQFDHTLVDFLNPT